MLSKARGRIMADLVVYLWIAVSDIVEWGRIVRIFGILRWPKRSI